jgi:V/A-type H+-transporting ATPase subunit I
MTGTTAELIKRNKEKLEEIENQLKAEQNKALSLSDNLLKLEILYDHYVNLLNRERTRGSAPATEQTVILEGWVRESDFHHLEKIVSKFEASSLVRIAPAEGEEVPVEIENKAMVRPFEVITRLYGMPNRTSVDPTIFLAPFFAVFFGLCLADVAYGLIMIALLTWIMRKMQGDKLIMWMLAICGVTTFSAGVLTGSWFSDALQQFEFLAFLRPVREYLMLFDPMKEPMRFFVLSLVLGYLQIQFGLFIALINNLLKKDIVSALCDQLTWIVLLNCLLGLGLSKAGILAADASKVFGFFAIAAAAGILFFSGHAEGWSVGRFGLGVFNLFSTVFFAGDILSYVRLMALGMVGSGFGMAVNVLVKLVMGVPYVGWILGAVVFVGGHLFNLALSMLGAFVHSLRLQFVEFFPKFLVGGGRDFLPFRKDYRYISIESKNFKTAKIVS